MVEFTPERRGARTDETTGIRFQNAATGHTPLLPFEAMEDFSWRPRPERAGLRYGLLRLNVAITLKSIGLDIRRFSAGPHYTPQDKENN